MKRQLQTEWTGGAKALWQEEAHPESSPWHRLEKQNNGFCLFFFLIQVQLMIQNYISFKSFSFIVRAMEALKGF